MRSRFRLQTTAQALQKPIRDKLFHPFVSFGKENGTGLGLTVVQKIVQDHGGEVLLERTPDGKRFFGLRSRAAPQRTRQMPATTSIKLDLFCP